MAEAHVGQEQVHLQEGRLDGPPDDRQILWAPILDGNPNAGLFVAEVAVLCPCETKCQFEAAFDGVGDFHGLCVWAIPIAVRVTLTPPELCACPTNAGQH